MDWKRSAFLPNSYQGTYIPGDEADPEKLVQNIRNKILRPHEQQMQLELLDKINEHLEGRVKEGRLARTQSLSIVKLKALTYQSATAPGSTAFKCTWSNS